jgi:hypothetical protein
VVQRGAEVVVLRIESIEPLLRVLLHVRLGLFSQRKEVLGVAVVEIPSLSRVRELFGGVLTDRFQHPVTLAGAPKEALLDERLQRVEVCIRHVPRGLQRASANEHAQPREEPPFCFGEKLMAPLDRRPERCLAGVGVAAAPEQVEALGQTLQDLRGRENAGAGSRQLDRQRQVVEAPAELSDGLIGFEARAGAE